MGPSVILRAPAKLNLTLEILNRRDDGYHNLRSVMVPVSLFDEIELGGTDSAELDAENLVSKALRALGVPAGQQRAALRKAIPVGAGLGGGSSDAAAILLAAMDGAFGSLGDRDFLALARGLGSDVPFFLTGTAALVEGTGERVTALGSVPPWQATIVKPPLHISTALAYAALDARTLESRPRNTSPTLQMGEALQRGDFEAVGTLLGNDFQAPVAAQHREIGVALDALRKWSSAPAILTGSGSCVFTLWKEKPPKAELELPAGFERFDVSFISSPRWRSEA
ncbi:MAG: 4-(cytidine 5'-diphospho)-2-C-methyl-D-erythritol kinase [Candidatus Eremiobacteraeota bacterium]|nr:4-(cytidine 5'-diphospho)-2-C-methyl-D-erythritol kinase [Candidatus Eremiobacteraeota bacterium]